MTSKPLVLVLALALVLVSPAARSLDAAEKTAAPQKEVIVLVKAGALVDLAAKPVLPGLIDVHTHVTSQPEDYYADRFRRSPIDVAVTAHVYARRTLEAGFTTLRVVGSPQE